MMPWNFPFWQVVRAAAPALMAGNALLLKHAANTTRCALELERVFRDAGAPDGLFGVLVARGAGIAPVVGDPRIAAVTLTGSEAPAPPSRVPPARASRSACSSSAAPMHSSSSPTPTSRRRRAPR